MTKNKLNKNQTFMGILTVQPDGRVRVEKAQKLTALNQYKNKWIDINAREFARRLNTSNLVIK